MTEELKVRLTCEEGNILFQIAAGFALPEKLGDQTFTVADRGIAADEVKELYLALKAYSPMAQKAKRLLIFGPLDNLGPEAVNRDGVKYREFINPKLEVEVRLNEDAVSGAVWCILGAVTPASGDRMSLAVEAQSELLWPIAAKFGKVRAIRELVGYLKGTPRRWKSDEDYAKEDKKEDKK